jgi:hypothetical protein
MRAGRPGRVKVGPIRAGRPGLARGRTDAGRARQAGSDRPASPALPGQPAGGGDRLAAQKTPNVQTSRPVQLSNARSVANPSEWGSPTYTPRARRPKGRDVCTFAEPPTWTRLGPRCSGPATVTALRGALFSGNFRDFWTEKYTPCTFCSRSQEMYRRTTRPARGAPGSGADSCRAARDRTPTPSASSGAAARDRTPTPGASSEAAARDRTPTPKGQYPRAPRQPDGPTGRFTWLTARCRSGISAVVSTRSNAFNPSDRIGDTKHLPGG